MVVLNRMYSGLAWLGLLCGMGSFACASATNQSNGPAVASESLHETAAPTRLLLQPIPLGPMTPSERSVEQVLRRDLNALLAVGERHSGNEWGLASATDLLAEQLEAKGISVEREGFMGPGGSLGQNLVVNFPGSELSNEVVLLGARYDSAPGSPGADDNATGAVALLELAKAQYGKTRRRTLRLVWFSDASARTQPEYMGAWHHLELTAKPRRADEPARIGTDLKLCVDLRGLGAFSGTLDSQRYAPGMPAGHPIAEFIEVLSPVQYMTQGNAVTRSLGSVSSVPVRSVTTLEPEPGAFMTPLVAFTAHGCPAVLVHDTGAMRFEQFGKSGDTAERIDFGRFARVVDALTRAVDIWVNVAHLGASSAADNNNPLNEQSHTTGNEPSQ
jgi:hypothetical protein